MASVTVGESQLQRIIRDLNDAVAELTTEHKENGEPITDDSPSLHKFSYKLEYLLQFDQKEKTTFLGSRKDYWDYFCECLSKMKGANDGIRFVKSISELKTSLGKGRAFIRYCLVHQRLADTLQQCLMNQRVTCDWYYARSPFLKSRLNVDIINHLYELNEIQFDVASRGYDLDSEWPTFARRTVGSVVPAANVWRPPSRCSSVNSLVSNYSQQTHEFLPGPDLGTSMIGDLGELGDLSCIEADDLRVQLDQSELQQRQLVEEVKSLKQEVGNLQEKLQASEPGKTNGEWSESHHVLKTTAEQQRLEERLTTAENKNLELIAKLEAVLGEKSKEVASYSNSAMKIEELLCKLKEAEEARLEARSKSEEWARQAEKLTQELKASEEKLKWTEETLAKLQKEYSPELQARVIQLQGMLSLKEREMENLHTQLQDLQSSLGAKDQQLEEVKRKAQGEYNELKQWSNSQQETLSSQILSLQEQLKEKDIKLSISAQKIQQLEDLKVESQGKKLDEYKAQCASLMEINAKLVHTVKRAEESNKEMVQTKTSLEKELVTLKASEKQLNERLNSVGLTIEEREKKLLEENQHLEESIQKAQENITAREEDIKRLEKENEDLRVGEPDDGPSSKENMSEDVSRLALAEAQLDLNMKEVSRLQEEVVELRAQLQVCTEERMKTQALQEVTEASREDLCAQTEQLKYQIEELNRRQVEELLRCREKEEALVNEVNGEAQARATLQTEVASMREELLGLKKQNGTLALENEEAKEALHRANTETAELGVHVCMLTGQNEEAKLRSEELSSKLQELEEVRNEAQKLKSSVEALTKDNARLLGDLKQADQLEKVTQELKQRLEESKEEARSIRKSNQREISTLRGQLGETATNHQDQIKGLNEELLSMKSQVEAEQEKVSTLETRLAELEALNTISIQKIEQKDACIAKSDTLLQQKEERLNQIQGDLSKAREELALSQKACQDLSENLRKAVTEKETCDLKASAEIDDLYRTKRNLEERLIELIREKDVLWQKSDALEFEQKLRAEAQLDRELPYCFGCHTQFSWWLRRHTCKLCGRPFCYYCCVNTVSSQQGGTRERCCKDCYTRHSATERHPQEDLRSLSPPSRSPLASTPTRPSMPSFTVALQSPRSDDAAFDIITDEEVNCVYEADSLPYTTAMSPGSMQQGSHDLSSSTSGGDLTADESEDLLASGQDAEICLLKSGEITLSVPFSMEEVCEFGKESRELFIKSSCYSLIPINVVTIGFTISWEFSSTPKSIAFSVVYREGADTPVEQAKVLIPLTKCSSHKELIKGQMKIRNRGIYSLIFDNSFSRFISKKVHYRLSVENPIASGGSDCS